MDRRKNQFGWKRKIGANVCKSISDAFENDSKDDSDESSEVDWLSLVPVKKRNIIGLEDGRAKSSRLVQEGTVLADSERYWEALKKWEEALSYSPCDSKIHEMKAQVLMELCEVYPAVNAAMKAVECEPTWWIAHQTLGRAHLGLGEVKMAIKSFSRAVHLNPDNRELWEDDLMWAFSLLQKKQQLEEENAKELKTQQNSLTVTELSNNDSNEDVSNTDIEVYRGGSDSNTMSGLAIESAGESIKRLPTNYIQMRDPT